MIHKLFLSLSIVLVSLQAHSQKVSLIKSFTHSFYGRSSHYSYTYNKQGNITSKTESHHYIDEKGKRVTIDAPRTSRYTNFKDSITYQKGLKKFKMVLNKQGLVEQEVLLNYGRSVRKYKYDAQKHLIYEEETNQRASRTSRSEIFYKYSQGNLVKQIRIAYTPYYGETRADSTITNYEYYLDKPNSSSNAHFGQNYRGKSSKNLLKSYWDKGGQKTTYLYKFDKKGRVRERIMEDTPQSRTTYEYYD